jgi:hypothetical protein
MPDTRSNFAADDIFTPDQKEKPESEAPALFIQ